MIRLLHRALLCAAALVVAAPAVAEVPAGLSAPLWAAWRDRFVQPDGRVVDNANGGISHSEGQGYGLLLASLAGDAVTFHRIWSFTRTQLLVRDDGLAAWRWEPDASPNITDINNASDGDLLIAYALALGGAAWGDDSLTEAAAAIASALWTAAIIPAGDDLVMLPGAAGFREGDRIDGPVVNLSYWVFEAFPALAAIDPEHDWTALADNGLKLLARSGVGPSRLPPEWSALGDGPPRPAAGFDRTFGYNAIRIPLYLARAGLATPALVEPFLASRDETGAGAVILLDSGARLEPLSDQGYRMALAAVDCAVNGTPVPSDLRTFAPDLYYPATLHLLAWFYLAEQRPGCL
ncbi:MAG: endoglucanase [Bauldia sp.]|nr:endoglucanase [Bauldia sp.]